MLVKDCNVMELSDISTRKYFTCILIHRHAIWKIQNKKKKVYIRFISVEYRSKTKKYQEFFQTKLFFNKKVLLREHKRHTAYRVASARYAAIQSWWGGGGYPRYPPHTIQTRLGGCPGYPPPSRPGRGYPRYPFPPSRLGMGYPPTIQTWLGVPPTI